VISERKLSPRRGYPPFRQKAAVQFARHNAHPKRCVPLVRAHARAHEGNYSQGLKFFIHGNKILSEP